MVTALALIPEVISFSFVSGVDPKVALVASIVLCLVMSVLGGRPAMVTAAAGSIALVIGPMVKLHGVGYILPTIILAGIIQIVFGLAGLARLMRFVPRSVMIGFVNALGILIFAAQVPHILNVPWVVYPLFALTIAIVLVDAAPDQRRAGAADRHHRGDRDRDPRQLTVPNVGGKGAMAPGLPGITAFTVPFDLETLRIIWPTALSVAFVGLLETLLTAKLVDDLTDTRSHKGRESWALGIANIAAGFYGGIGGCAMIAQTVVNVKIGNGRTRISTAVAAIVLLVLVTGLSDLMAQIPMVALAAVMMIVAIKTINWHSVQPATLKRMPIPETLVMAVDGGGHGRHQQSRLRHRRRRPAGDGAVRAPGRACHSCRAHAEPGRPIGSLQRPRAVVLRQQQRSGRTVFLRRRSQAGRDRSHPFADLGRFERRSTGCDRNQIPRTRRHRHLHRARPAQFRIPRAADRPARRLNSSGRKDRSMAILHWISTLTARIGADLLRPVPAGAALHARRGTGVEAKPGPTARADAQKRLRKTGAFV